MVTIKQAQDIISNFTDPNNADVSLNTKRSLYSSKNIANQSGYPNQREHLLHELTVAQEKYGADHDFKIVYNHIHSAPLQFYLANQLGIATDKAEVEIGQQQLPMMSEAKKFRDNYLPYAEVETAMSRLIKG
ncbi:hypothetical protein OZX69_05580 [Lactobacillus sp. ESL0731]|uniref:hypothetical protein n=1 Tax=unclassified Lactobacillus TaxID=2620435 RepID=UPI0023F65818|nr:MULTISPECIES: hypothetical protein [unclassified Lactobacillus]WEV50431.1 hypothetical protein OZX63_05575 [Lactobacillus sp. ESL0700]WEV61561.1 hypothetical protein OZX69_05580 [Lactobacillus sp. ESL0731]